MIKDITPEIDGGGAGGVAVANAEVHAQVNPFNLFVAPLELAFTMFSSLWERLGETCDYL